MLNAEAGPLYGIVWPILISVSLGPESYFFCANAGEAASSTAVAASARATRILAFLAPNARCDSATMACTSSLRFPRFLRIHARRAYEATARSAFGDNCTFVRNIKDHL